VCQLKLYKTSLCLKNKDATIKDFRLSLLSNIELLYIEHLIFSSHTLTKLEVLGGGLYKCSLSFTRKETMCEDSTFLNVLSPAYLP
jgi:hypothetical protein